MENCRTDSKKHCMACQHYDYCDKACRCNGNCHECDDYDCENNPKYAKKKPCGSNMKCPLLKTKADENCDDCPYNLKEILKDD